MDAPAAQAPVEVSLKGLVRLAWPLVFSRLSQTVIGLSDAFFVAPLGPVAVAAVATGAFNALTLLILPNGVMYMVASFASQLLGRGEPASARRYAWYGLAVALLTEVVCVLAVPLVSPVLGLLPYEPALTEAMTRFLAIRLAGGGAVVGLEALSNYYGGLGRTRPGMAANVAAMVLNVFGNWVLIEGHLGAPALGVAGSALASALATTAAFLGFLGYFLLTGEARPRGLTGRELWRLLRFGVPSGVNWLVEFLAFMFFMNVVVAGLGTTPLAAMNAVLLLNTVAFMPAFALASSGAILVGQAIGAGRLEEVPRAVKLTLGVAMGWQGLMGLAYVAVPRLVMAPFARGEHAAELSEVGVRMLLVSAAWQLFDATATTLAEALRAAGDTLFPTLVRLLIAWLLFAPGSYWSARTLGWTEVGTTAWLVGYLALLAGVLAWRFRSGAWRKVRLLESPEAAPGSQDRTG